MVFVKMSGSLWMACRRPRPRGCRRRRLGFSVEEGDSFPWPEVGWKYFLYSLCANAVKDGRFLLGIGGSVSIVDDKVRGRVTGFESATVVCDRRSPLFSIIYRTDRTHLFIPAPLVCAGDHHFQNGYANEPTRLLSSTNTRAV